MHFSGATFPLIKSPHHQAEAQKENGHCSVPTTFQLQHKHHYFTAPKRTTTCREGRGGAFLLQQKKRRALPSGKFSHNPELKRAHPPAHYLCYGATVTQRNISRLTTHPNPVKNLTRSP